MRKKTRTIRRSPGQVLTTVLAVMALVISMGIAAGLSAEPSHAETYTVTGKYVTDNFDQYTDSWPADLKEVPADLETTFNLYKVGTYSHDKDGNSIIVLDEAYSSVTLPATDKDDPNWTKDWLRAALSLSQLVQGDPVAGPQTVTGNNPFSLSVEEKGVYLVLGTSSKVEQNGKTIWWRPQPMLVQVFDGSKRDLEIKPEAETAHDFRVTKYWAGDPDVDKKYRPESVTVKIYYDMANNPDPVYTEKLDSSNDWCFSWTAGEDQNDPFAWTVVEQPLSGEAAEHYTFSIEPVSVTGDDADVADPANLKLFKLTNTAKTPPSPPEPTTTTEPPTTTTAAPTTTMPPTKGTEPPEPNSHTKTGDTMVLTRVIAVMAAALLLAIILIIRWRRKGRKDGGNA